MNNYTVYHLHTDISSAVTNIDSINKTEEYVAKAKELGMTSLAISEHGSVMNWKHKKDVIENADLKYIHAEEFYVTNDNHCEDKHRDNYHFILIAKNLDGVRELNKLSSIAFNRDDWHFYYVPRISFDELFGTSDNIIITSACLGGALNSGTDELQKSVIKFFAQHKDRCYLEIQHHNVKDQITYNQKLYKISKAIGIPLIAGTDTHCLDSKSVDGRIMLQKAKGIYFDNEEGWDLTFKSYDELIEAYRIQNSLPMDVVLEAINNTNLMAEQIEEFEFDYTHKYPKLYKDSETVFKEKICKGIKDRGINKLPNKDIYMQRIKEEYETYKYNGAIDFMLLEEDYKTEMRNRGIEYGYSRGSCSGSLIAYLLHITDIDSVKFNLNFSRFMNKERVSLADIDTDWASKDRDVVREYLCNKNGLYCCDIITFNTVQLKGAVREIGRALEIPLSEVDDICNKLETDEEKLRNQYPTLFYYADMCVDVVVSVGFHPSALVVSPITIDDYFGTFTTSTSVRPISQWNMKEVDSLNFVKLDILSLDNIGLINDTCKLANIERLTPQNVEDDINVWKSIRDDTTLIFQFTSDFASDYIGGLLNDKTVAKFKEYNPNFNYMDLMSLATAALRPAGESYRDLLRQGIVRDNGHEALNEMLAPTCGYLVYQCQIIEFLNKFCGYTMGQADIVRRHFAKKTGTEEDIPKIKAGFIATMNEKYGVEEDEAESLIGNFLQVIIDASNYLFSLNHALPYSYISYILGYLRYHYPLEFLTCALNIFETDLDKTTNIINYANKVNIKIKGIKFGKSSAQYTIDKQTNSIYKGIASIKFCNGQIANELLELSKNKYTNFITLLEDINKKTSVNSRQLNILIGLGFFSDFGKNKYLMKVVEIYNKFGHAKIVSKKNQEEFAEKYGLSEYIMVQYSNKETKSQWREIDNIGLVNALCNNVPNESLSIKEQIRFEQENLGYIEYTNSKIPSYCWIVLDFKTYKSPYKPYVIVYNISTGQSVKTKVTDSNWFKLNPFELYSILIFENFGYQNKRKKVDDKWILTDEQELVLNNYTVLTKEMI